VAAEVLRQLIARGERVMFVSHSVRGATAALQELEEELRERAVLACGLPIEPSVEALRASLEQMQEAERSRELPEKKGPPLEEAAEKASRLLESAQRCEATLARLNVEREALAAECSGPRQGQAGEKPAGQGKAQDQHLREELARAREEAVRVSLELEESRRREEASSRGWLSSFLSWLTGGGSKARTQELERKLGGLLEAEEKLTCQLRRTDSEPGEGSNSSASSAQPSEMEILAARQEQMARQVEEASTRLARAQEEWRELWRGWSEAVPDCTPEGLERGLTQLREQHQKLVRPQEARARWLAALKRSLPELIDAAKGKAAVLAGTARGLACESLRFDVLVAEEAHRIPDGILQALADKCQRWVLIGEPPLLATQLPGRPARTPASAFHALWQAQLPKMACQSAQWRQADGRLIASLRPIDSNYPVTCEPLFDRPEVEVLIGRPAGAEQDAPCEVRFPSTTPMAEARAFVRTELQELAIDPAGHPPHWFDLNGAPALAYCTEWPGDGPSLPVPIEEGIVEHLCPCASGPESPGWKTAGLTFPATWGLGQARTWVASRLGDPGLGRACHLARSHRAAPELAIFLEQLLYQGPSRPPDTLAELIPVPEAPYSRGADLGVLRPAQGASLEVDLGGRSGAISSIPAHLRARLPSEGVVNLTEANAVLRWLRAFLAGECRQGLGPGPSHGATLAVLAATEAQAILLQALLEPVLESSGVDCLISDAEGARGKHCLVAAVSLVRSKGAEAAPFSRHPEDLAVLLTRASRKLVLFGDPGFMARRAQWYGSLEHQGDLEAAQEQALMRSLVGSFLDASYPALGPEAARAARGLESRSA
jgi:hypothetical protein